MGPRWTVEEFLRFLGQYRPWIIQRSTSHGPLSAARELSWYITDLGAQIMIPQGSITQIELEYMLIDENLEPKALPYPLLKKITDNFSEKLVIGRGGFAVVYKGKLDNGTIAVKKLSNIYMQEEQFHREVECLMKVKHKNVLRFLGYCADTQGNMASYNGRMVMADVQQRLLCFEYLPKGNLDDFIKDTSEELEWRKRYQVIKGICEGINYLHQKNIVHLDLKPENILFDKDMMPKITDFGISRCFEEDQTRIITKNVGGTLGYLAPEFYVGEITHKFDLYSLGIIIMEMLTGKKGCHNIANVCESWSSNSDILWWDQIRVCAEIGIECSDLEPAKRPENIKHIIDRLLSTESSTHVIPAGGPKKLLVLHPPVLRFPFEANKVITCPLQLTNNTDKPIAFRLMDKSVGSSFLRLPLCGVVLPNTPYTLVVTTKTQEKWPRKWITDVNLQGASLILGDDEHIKTFQSHPEQYFQQMGNAVQKVELKGLYTVPQQVTISTHEPISTTIKLLCKVEHPGEYSLDTNHAKQWIMIGEENGHVGIWDYAQRKVDSLKLPTTKVRCVRFIERKQWIVAGTEDGYIHVYSCETKIQKLKSFRAFTDRHGYLSLLAVHLTRPYLLSAGTHMKLWDWDKGWECVQTFECYFGGFRETIYDAAFNHNDTFATTSSNTFLSETATYLHKVWSFDSPKSVSTLPGHSKSLNCLAFFICQDQEFLVTGSDDHNAKIWYLQENICAYTLEAFTSPVRSVLYQPNLHTLIIGSDDGAIYLWSTKNCRTYSDPPTLTRIINIGCIGAVYHLASAMGSIVIGRGNTIAIMDTDNVSYQEQSTDYNKKQLSADTRQQAGETTSKIAGSINKLPVLDVHPLELRFPYHPNEPISCSLYLTNNTNENVAFRLVDRGGKSPWCFTKLPLYGIVPRRSTYTLIVTTKEEMKLKEKKDFDLVIQSSLLEHKYIVLFQNQCESDQFFEEAKELGNMVHEVILKPVYLQHEDITSEDQNISAMYNRDNLKSIDAHPTEPWILTGHISGYARVWDYEMTYPTNFFEVSDNAGIIF
ncbi:hypothetical protein VPH35_132597 [Triticum aestivum]